MSKPTLTVEGVCHQLPEVKRCHLPGIVLKSDCPVCAHTDERHLEGDYLSYGSMMIRFGCEPDEEDDPERWLFHETAGVPYSEWTIEAWATVTISATNPQEAP